MYPILVMRQRSERNKERQSHREAAAAWRVSAQSGSDLPLPSERI